MKETVKVSDVLKAIDVVVLIVSALVATGYAVTRVPNIIWIPCWSLMAVTLFFALKHRESSNHWPSSIFALVQIVYIGLLFVDFFRSEMPFQAAVFLGFGLIFVHGFLYLIAAKSWMRSKGYVKEPNHPPQPTTASSAGSRG